jgi:restriction system protein
LQKKQRNVLRQQHQERLGWEHQYGRLQVDELKKFTGIEFEEYLAGLFKNHGYRVEMTALTGDFGADLILLKDQKRVAV